MRDRLTGLLEKADLALGSVSEVVDEETVAPLIDVVRGVRTRLAYPEDVLVVALAGGTGSGKSSLFNALCGDELVDVGGVRPTTSRPAAGIPVAVAGALDGYLDRLAIPERHTYEDGMICLLDLPDTDSVEVEHRHRVDSLLALVDLVVWVTDPEKYRDARLHEEYLRPLSDYSAQFLFVINQVDRLTGAEVEEVRQDLRRALGDDGIVAPEVMVISAAPPVGPPVGLESLQAALEEKRSDRATLYGKLLTDLAATCRSLESVAGRSLDFDRRASIAVDRAANALADGDIPAATGPLVELLETLESETGGVTADKLAALAADIPRHVRRIESQLPDDQPTRGWIRRLLGRDAQPTGGDREQQARSLLSEAVARPARAILARRAVAVASVAELAVDVEGLRHQTGC